MNLTYNIDISIGLNGKLSNLLPSARTSSFIRDKVGLTGKIGIFLGVGLTGKPSHLLPSARTLSFLRGKVGLTVQAGSVSPFFEGYRLPTLEPSSVNES